MKINRTLLKLAILFVAINDAGVGATNAAIPLIMKAMPQVAPSLIQLIVTVPALLTAMVPLFYPKLVETTKKRTLLWIGCITFVIGGVAPAFILDNIWLVLFFRALLGVGTGFLVPLGTDLVVDFFEGKERQSMLGYITAMVGISGMAFSQLGGILVGIQWNYVYYAYLVSILFMAVPLILLPEPDRAAKLAAEKAAAQKMGPVNSKLNLGVFIMAAGLFVFNFAWYIMPTNIAIVVMAEGVSPAMIGLLFSIMSIACCVMGALYGPLVRALKTTIMLPLCFVLNGVGAFIIYYGHTFSAFSIGIGLMGMALGVAIPSFYGKVTSLVSYSAAAKAIAATCFFQGLGGFVQPVVSSWLGANGIGRPIFFTGAIISVVMIVVIMIADKAFQAQAVPVPQQAEITA